MSAMINVPSLQIRDAGRGVRAPSIAISDDLWSGDEISFKLQTDKGNILVEVNYFQITCRASIEALTAYGLSRDNWVPKPDSVTNKTRQAVLFDEEGAYLVVGRFDQTKLNPADDVTYLTICRAGNRFHVEIPLTTKQEKKYQTFLDNRREREERNAVTPDDFTDGLRRGFSYHNRMSAGEIIDVLKAVATSCSSGVRYSNESEARILRLIGELRSAFLEANVVAVTPAPTKYQQRGNVVCWPGSGKVSPVPLGAIH